MPDQPRNVSEGDDDSKMGAAFNTALDNLLQQTLFGPMEELYRSKEWIISIALGKSIYHEHVMVSVAKPKWMPKRLFVWLMKSVFVVSNTHTIPAEKYGDPATSFKPPANGKEHLN